MTFWVTERWNTDAHRDTLVPYHLTHSLSFVLHSLTIPIVQNTLRLHVITGACGSTSPMRIRSKYIHGRARHMCLCMCLTNTTVSESCARKWLPLTVQVTRTKVNPQPPQQCDITWAYRSKISCQYYYHRLFYNTSQQISSCVLVSTDHQIICLGCRSKYIQQVNRRTIFICS